MENKTLKIVVLTLVFASILLGSHIQGSLGIDLGSLNIQI